MNKKKYLLLIISAGIHSTHILTPPSRPPALNIPQPKHTIAVKLPTQTSQKHPIESGPIATPPRGRSVTHIYTKLDTPRPYRLNPENFSLKSQKKPLKGHAKGFSTIFPFSKKDTCAKPWLQPTPPLHPAYWRKVKKNY